MSSSRRITPATVGIYLVAGLLLANLIAVLAKDRSDSLLPAAFAQRQAPIAGGAGVFVMPAQMGVNAWGCYLLDVDSQTLCAYQYFPTPAQLKLVAARDFRYDRRLHNMNTSPPPDDVREAIEKELKARGADKDPATNP